MRLENRQARFDYELVDKVEAGVKLSGAEVKSARAGKVSFAGARCVFLAGQRGEELWLVGMQISAYEYARGEEIEPTRSRLLLLKKSELVALKSRAEASGLTLVPWSCYDKHGLIKIEVALARGKKKYEKRELVKKRESDREVARRLKQVQQ